MNARQQLGDQAMRMGPAAPAAPAAPQSAQPVAPSKQPGGPRKLPSNPRQSEYDRLMGLVDQLRGQFPNKSDREILALARKIMSKEQEDMDLWDGVKSEYGVNKVQARRPPTRAALRPTPAPLGTPPAQETAPQDDPKAYIQSGAMGVMTPNPAYGKKHGLVWSGDRWEDGSMQNQAMEAQKAEQAFLAEKRQIELEQLRMQMELDRLQKEREMRGLRQEPVLSGLYGGAAKMQPVRPLAGRGLIY